MLSFDNSYSALPDRFFARVRPTAVGAPRMIKFNHALAAELGITADLDNEEGAAIFAGNAIPAGANPISMAYAGHQFGAFVPQLGDGRAILLGEVIDRNGIRRDIQLKGAGRTPYSRGGDGRAAIGPVLREYAVSEAMHALGIPTTRALAAVTTGDPVYRETTQPGAVLTRIAASHIRVGTFQFFAARGDVEGLKALADYTIDRLYPDLKKPDLKTGADPYLALLRRVAERQASLVARWLGIGFIHGVMNTDNSSISGETIDFGPCAFMEAYDPGTVFSSIDRGGRYAYQNQGGIAQWNVARLAETLLPLIDEDVDKAVEMANQAVIDFAGMFTTAWYAVMRRKLGLVAEENDDGMLIQSLLDLMQANEVDFTRGFRALSEEEGAFVALFPEPTGPAQWLAAWRDRAARETTSDAERSAMMRAANPVYIPRNHLIEEAITAAAERDDFGPFETLLDVLSQPYEKRTFVPERYELPAKPEERVLRTFCGT